MSDSVAGVVLAAGRGDRLRPLTLLRPKPLCPVAGVALVDHARARLPASVADVAVNVHHGRALLESHLAGAVHLSIEPHEALGTAGALGHLRPWLDGRAAVVVNGDAWCPGRLDAALEGWDGERVRVVVVGEDELRPGSQVAGAVLPWAEVERLEAVPSGLYERSWLPALVDGRLEVIRHDGPFIDCGTPGDYLRANLTANGGESVVAPGAVVAGEVVRSVVWPGSEVRAGERLVDAVRFGGTRTVLVRGVRP